MKFPLVAAVPLILAVAAIGYALHSNAFIPLAKGEGDDYKIQAANEASLQANEVHWNGGSLIDQCVHDKLAAEAWLQADDQEKYRGWSARASRTCTEAGVPQ